jgi:hypothetical protein
VTKVGPLRTTDKMTVTDWAARQRMAVRHTGIISGTGIFELHEAGASDTKVTWTEDLRFPWYLGGVVAAFVARPVLKRIWMGNLRRFRSIAETRNL